MQLGTRWNVGDEPPSRLPQALTERIRAVEADLESPAAGAYPMRWTLTWLEGRPTVELDDGTLLT
ncbi:MAG: hypothetical protein ACSLE3_12830 [Microbacteriaceae bacterium]